MYKQRSSLPINSGRSRSIPDGLISSPEDIRDNAPEYVDSGTHSSHHVGSPVGLDLNDPFRSVTGWLNHEGSIYNTLGLEGELNIIANSDEKPMGVKIGTLGYAHGDSVHNPFELLSETEAGTSIFLAPPELATSKSFDPSAFFTSHSMSMLVARSTPLGLGLLPNLNLTSVGSATSKTTESPNPVHVLIKARSPSSNSSPENLCATFYTHLAQNPTDDDSPMFLERCDGSFIPGRASNSVSLTTTQLWQYDPKTHELKPILQSESRTSSKNAPSGEPKSTHSVASGMGGS
ncbi:hypothetical protein OPQ81_010917 [Rhizoctonia solani]|nr:hypothetical protein OPQ81_010917 [Rhizoctonia solani]